jgi:hypothetical protein
MAPRPRKEKPISAAPATPTVPLWRRPRVQAAGLFAFLLTIYLANGGPLLGTDASANNRLALNLIEHGRLTFTPDETPSLFTWARRTPMGLRRFRFSDWQARTDGVTPRELLASGELSFGGPKYLLVATKKERHYANTFGLGSGLVALPAVAAVRLFVPDLSTRIDLLWQVGKLVAAACVAGSAIFIFFAGLGRVSSRAALLVALAYGLGTCVWSTSSQALWQHGPHELFLAAGTFFLLNKDRRWFAFLSGLSYAAAVACRPTGVLVVAAVAVYLLVADRRALLRYGLGALPIALGLMLFSWNAFGNPIAFGQELAAHNIALSKTGKPDLWQTPLGEGVAGLLFSPGRGLFFYSPIAIFGVWGMVRVWRDPTWSALRPLTVAALVTLGVAAKRFDWWGGWSFGYRPIVDLATLLAFFAIAVVPLVTRSRLLVAAAALLFIPSVTTQIIGAWAYDLVGWNSRSLYVATLSDGHQERFDDLATLRRTYPEVPITTIQQDIDKPEYRHRLWSFTDNPIGYYWGNFSAAVEARRRNYEDFIRDWA